MEMNVFEAIVFLGNCIKYMATLNQNPLQRQPFTFHKLGYHVISTHNL